MIRRNNQIAQVAFRQEEDDFTEGYGNIIGNKKIQVQNLDSFMNF